VVSSLIGDTFRRQRNILEHGGVPPIVNAPNALKRVILI